MLRITIPVEKGNEAFKDGSLASTIQGLMEELKPEAAYFAPEGGERGAMIVFDMTDPSQIPQIAEKLFANLHAAVEFLPVMNADDLKRGLGGAWVEPRPRGRDWPPHDGDRCAGAVTWWTRCLIPGFDGAVFSGEWKEALWDRFYTAAPQRQRRSVEQYKIVKRA